jgi:hypothetical protein
MVGMMGGKNLNSLSSLLTVLADPKAAQAAIDAHTKAAQAHEDAAAGHKQAEAAAKAAQAALAAKEADITSANIDIIAAHDRLNALDAKLVLKSHDLDSRELAIKDDRTAANNMVVQAKRDAAAIVARAREEAQVLTNSQMEAARTMKAQLDARDAVAGETHSRLIALETELNRKTSDLRERELVLVKREKAIAALASALQRSGT